MALGLGPAAVAGAASASPPIPTGHGMFVLAKPQSEFAQPPPVVLKVAADGSTTDITPTGLLDPQFLSASPSGDVFISDYAQSSIVRVSSTGVRSTVGSGLSYPNALWYDGWTGGLFVADTGNHRVVEFINGSTRTIASGLNDPAAVVGDEAGNVYIADWGNGITKIDPQGNSSPVGSFQLVRSLDLDPQGNLVVDTYLGNGVWAVLGYANGTTTPVPGPWDSHTSYEAKADHNGNVFVSDGNNSSTGSLWEIAGGTNAAVPLEIAGSANIWSVALADDASEPLVVDLHASAAKHTVTAGRSVDVPVTVTGAGAGVAVKVTSVTAGLTTTVSGTTVRVTARPSFSGRGSVVVSATAPGATAASATFAVVVNPPAVTRLRATRHGTRTTVSWQPVPTAGVVYRVLHGGVAYRVQGNRLVVRGGRLGDAWAVVALGAGRTVSRASRALEGNVSAGTVHFANRSSRLTAAARAGVLAAGRRLVRLGYREVLVVGFCAPGGTAAYNGRLSSARAAAVAAVLRRAQLRVVVRGAGARHQIPGGAATNRRAAITALR